MFNKRNDNCPRTLLNENAFMKVPRKILRAVVLGVGAPYWLELVDVLHHSNWEREHMQHVCTYLDGSCSFEYMYTECCICCQIYICASMVPVNLNIMYTNSCIYHTCICTSMVPLIGIYVHQR